jgi:hypothetical protein
MMLVKIVVGATAFGMTLAMILGAVSEGVSGQIANNTSQLTTHGRTWYEILCTSIASILSAVSFAFTFVTVAFAIAQRKHVHIEKSGTGIDNLPPVPEHDNKISRVQCIFSISFTTLFFILFVTAPGFFRMPDGNGNFVPVLNGEYLKKMWMFLALFCACGIVRDSVKLYELRYSKKLLIVTIATNIIAAVSALFFFNEKGSVMSETYMAFMSTLLYDNDFIRNTLVHFQLFFLIIIIVALALDTLETMMKYLKERR